MSIVTRPAQYGDNDLILDLIRRSRGDGLSEREKSERGFVQGHWDDAELRRREDGEGAAVVALDGETLAGVVLASFPGPGLTGPPELTVRTLLSEGHATPESLFLYGPVAVDPHSQGQGVMRSLLDALARRMLARGRSVGSAFVEQSNAHSLGVHRHLGMTERESFDIDERSYVVFTFDPADMVGSER